MTAFPKVALIGPGAIGTTIAAALFERGGRRWSAGVPPIRRWCCALTRVRSWCPARCTPTRWRYPPLRPVFVAVKTTQTEAIAPRLTALCSPDTVVCVLQNGVEQRQQFAP